MANNITSSYTNNYTLFSGLVPVIDQKTTNATSVLPTSVASKLQAYKGAYSLQVGFFTPTQNGSHTFNVTSSNGSYLVIDGQSVINTTGSGTTSNSISLTGNQPVSFVYAGPLGSAGVNGITYSVGGGSLQPIQNNQISTPTDIHSNPLLSVNTIIATINSSATPGIVKPTANVLPTNILANSSIATVPAPAVFPSMFGIPIPMGKSISSIPGSNFTINAPTLVDIHPSSFTTNSTTSATGSLFTTSNVTPVATYSKLSSVISAGYATTSANTYLRSQTVGMEVTGLIPNTRLSIFCDGVNITGLCAPAEVEIETGTASQSKDPNLDYKLSGKKGDPIVTTSNGMATVAFFIPDRTFTTGTKNIAFFNYTSDSDSYDAKYANNTCRAFTTFSSTNFAGIDHNGDDVIVFATAPTDSGATSGSSNTTSTRTGGNTNPSYIVEPLCQSFYIGSDVSRGQDGVFLSSVDLFFSAKSNTQPVTVEIRTMAAATPTSTAIPYSTVTLPSSAVTVTTDGTANNNYATKFHFPKPVYLKAGYYYAVAVNPGGQSPDYSLWTATVGDKLANGSVTSNWGKGQLYKSTTSGATWTSIQNQFLKFNVNIGSYASNGTATIVNGDYEFITFLKPSQIPFQVGEYVYQQPTAHISICSVNTSSNTLTVNTTAYGGLSTINPTPLLDFSPSDHIVVVGGVPNADPLNLGRFNYNLFGNAVSLKVLSVDAGGLNLVFGYANGAAITGTPWSNGACYVYKAQPGHIAYNTSTKTITGTGTRFDVYQNTNELDRTDKRPLVIHTGNTTVGRGEVLWPNNISNATSLFVKNSPLNANISGSQAIPVSAPVGKVVSIDYTRNLVILDKSTANSLTGAASAANLYATTSFFAPGRTLLGTQSGATAIIAAVNDMKVGSVQPVVLSSTPQGTSVTYTANVTASDYTTFQYPTFNPAVTNYFTNNQVIVASRTNEVLNMSGNKSFVITANLASNSGLLTPTVDLLSRATLQSKSNMINQYPVGENTNNGTATSKSISKIVTLSDGNDAEDLTVYLTAYKPQGTNLTVYAKLLNASDGDKFEDKDWSVLVQVTDPNQYSDSANQQDYKEFQYSLPKNPMTVPFYQLLTTNNSTTIVSTNGDTNWQTNFSNGQLVTLYSDVYGTNFEVNQIVSINSNTNITLANPVGLANTTAAIVASMPYPYSAFKNSNNGNIVRYYNASGMAYDSFKKFAIKIVFTAQNPYLVPKVSDMRAIALSV